MKRNLYDCFSWKSDIRYYNVHKNINEIIDRYFEGYKEYLLKHGFIDDIILLHELYIKNLILF